MSARVVSAWVAALALVCLAGGCTTEKLGTGARCERNSECAAPLVCRLDRCRRECNTTRDCPAGLACVLDGQGIGACQVSADKSCARQSDCPDPLVCRFTQCTNACNTDVDCPAGSFCMTDPSGNACIDPSGKPCVHHEECSAAGQTCALDGRCRDECVNHRDCRFGSFCCDNDRACHETEAECGMVPPRDMGPRDMGGVGPTVDAGPDAAGPRPGLPAGTLSALSCGGDTTCVETSEGLHCWGRNDHGQLGAGTISTAEPTPMPIDPTGASIRRVVCEGNTCCGVSGDDGVRCWGELADFDTGVVSDRTTPVRVPGLPPQWEGYVTMMGGTFAASFSRNDTDPPGWVYGNWLWGDNTHGQLGDGTTTSSFAPVMLTPALPGAGAMVGVGDGFACGQTTSRLMRCWGRNDEGQLARGTTTPMELVPADAMLPPTYDLASFGRAHACAPIDSRRLVCWGRGDEGQIGDGANVDRPTPVEVIPEGTYGLGPGLFDCTGNACCALLPDAGRPVVCWGEGPGGIASNVPMPIPALPDADPMVWARGVCIGSAHVCVATRDMRAGGDDAVYCWGDNTHGQLGNGTLGGASATPVEVLRAR